ncbi:MAG: hypothetical protein Q9191_003190 [Dirinaria sp. TL-2023a]
MCGPASAISRNGAGAVAIIHCRPGSGVAPNQLRLFFWNPSSPTTSVTQVSAETENGLLFGDRLLGLRIHNHGDLTVAPSLTLPSVAAHVDCASGILDDASEALDFVVSDDGQMAMAKLGERLELAVGGEGVIGKMVSVTSGGLEYGDGIIGWN